MQSVEPSVNSLPDAASLRNGIRLRLTTNDRVYEVREGQWYVDLGASRAGSSEEGGTPEALAVEAVLRHHMQMYDWGKREAAAINDFILTVRHGVAEELSPAPQKHDEIIAAVARLQDTADSYGDFLSGHYLGEAVANLRARHEPATPPDEIEARLCYIEGECKTVLRSRTEADPPFISVATVEWLIAQLRSARLSPPAGATDTAKDETRWLLGYTFTGSKWVARLEQERHRSPIGNSVFSVPVETTDANEAMAFVRERDAQAMLESIEFPWRGILRVEEHLWTAAARSQGGREDGQ